MGIAQTKQTNWCTSFNSFSIILYISFCFTPYLCSMSSNASSIDFRTRLMSSSMRVDSNCGLLAHILFLAEGFFGETFLFNGVTIPIGGSSGGVASPPPYYSSPSSPPPCPFSSSSPPLGELNLLSSESLSSSSLSISWTSSYFFFFFVPLDCLTCSTHVTMGLPMVSMLDNFASNIGTINSSGHLLLICSISSSVSL
jgi:hypothetical protein